MGGRLMFPALILGALILLVSNCAFGQNEEQNAYCAYAMQQAMADSSLLRAPEAVGGIAQPNSGTPPQLYWGLSNSLANYSRAKLAMEAARKNCESYRATTRATGHIQYALPRLEREALRHRAELLQQAIEQLDVIITRNLRVVEVQNLTRPMLYSVQSIRTRLVADRLNTELKIAALYVPDAASNLPLKQLVSEKQSREADAQRSMAIWEGQNHWDVILQAGGRKRVSPFFGNSSIEPYGQITISYNLGSRSNNSHLEKAATAYTDWKRVQDGEVTHNAQVLQLQILQSISVEKAGLRELYEQANRIDSNLQMLVGIDTASALGFTNQLEADKLALQVEIGDVTFRIQELQDYLESNF